MHHRAREKHAIVPTFERTEQPAGVDDKTVSRSASGMLDAYCGNGNVEPPDSCDPPTA